MVNQASKSYFLCKEVWMYRFEEYFEKILGAFVK